jgi:hypothetical protein
MATAAAFLPSPRPEEADSHLLYALGLRWRTGQHLILATSGEMRGGEVCISGDGVETVWAAWRLELLSLKGFPMVRNPRSEGLIGSY